jgi:hypothetical protein
MDTPKKKRAPGAGRKPIKPEDRHINTSIRLTPTQREKFDALGGIKWLREFLDNSD